MKKRNLRTESEKKYEILFDDDPLLVGEHTLYRIKALKAFKDVYKGDIGGFIEKESNLSQKGDCWVYDNGKVYDDAVVYGNAKVCNTAKVFGNARVSDNAKVFDNAKVYDNAEVFDKARVFNNAKVYNNAVVYDSANIYKNALVYDNAKVCKNAQIFGYAEVYGNAKVRTNAYISSTDDYVSIQGIGIKNKTTTFYKTEDGDVCVAGFNYSGTLDEFKDKIKQTYKDDKSSKEHLMLANLIEYKFSKQGE